MASDEIIDLETLLKPISDENPGGEDIRQDASPDSAYQNVRDARGAARSAERSHIDDSTSGEADQQWRAILEQAPEILSNQAKDLEVASWYTEALLRRHGFQGLRDGFRLIHGLIEQYWDNLYPSPDEDGLETRVAPLSGLNGEGSEGVLIAPIRNVPITESGDPNPFSFWKYQQALEIEKIIDDGKKKDKAGKLGFTIEDIERAVDDSSELFFVNLRDDLEESIETYEKISHALDELCGVNDAPPTSNIIKTLQDCLGAVKFIAKSKLPVPEPETDATDGAAEISQAGANGSSAGEVQSISGPIKSRQDAFRRLKEISDFFRKTEPHSPISYIIERAVKWGDMPLERLVKELIPDQSARDVFGSLTGVGSEDDQL